MESEGLEEESCGVVEAYAGEGAESDSQAVSGTGRRYAQALCTL